MPSSTAARRDASHATEHELWKREWVSKFGENEGKFELASENQVKCTVN
jgi:hypothetical protein